MIIRIMTLLFLVCTFSAAAQLQNKSWHQFPAAGGIGSSVQDRTSSIHVTDATGKHITSQPANNGISTLDISHVQSGLYFVQFHDGQSSIVLRLIKE